MNLEQVADPQQHTFCTPSKKINDGDDLQFFFTSKAYRDLSTWLFQLNRSVFPVKQDDGSVTAFSVDSCNTLSKTIQHVRDLLASLSALVESAPPDTGPRRFGNVAFRKWYELAEGQAKDLIKSHLAGIVSKRNDNEELVNELRAYLLGAFGSAQRLDYGTGHELSFIAFLGCLWKLGAFEVGEESVIVLEVIQPYLKLVRKLIMTYTLEPAGSHGVWGLDDHSFVPYIFGSAQLGPAVPPNNTRPVPTEGSLNSEPPPSSVTSRPTVSEYKDSNMYFSAINFIYEVKRGPFWEHSPVLYDISGITDGWAKINKGMLKMYMAEVLGKFPVVQHFPFGSLFTWEADPEASARVFSSVHAQQQPPAMMQSRDVPPVAPSRMSAPRMTRPGVGAPVVPSTHAATGIPSTRAPWAQSSMPTRTVMPPSRNASAGTRGLDGMPRTTAPWAKKSDKS